MSNELFSDKVVSFTRKKIYGQNKKSWIKNECGNARNYLKRKWHWWMSDRSLNNSTKRSALLAYSWWDILMTIIFSRKFLLIISLCQKLILILVSTSKKSGKKLIQRNIAIVCVSQCKSSFHFEQKVTFQTRDFRLAPLCIKTNLAKKNLVSCFDSSYILFTQVFTTLGFREFNK